MGLRGAIGLFQNPHSALKYRANITTTQKVLRDEIEAKSAGHPSVFSIGKENKLAVSLKA